ncbi:MAG TPA: response regulator [Bryobacteraceae bacterium]|nr:response regulator [Bryobacteraceae bacterium]
MTDSKDLKLLLVEDDLGDEQLLCEALIEIEEVHRWCNWRKASVVQVDHLADALDCLRRERFSVVLLNLSLPDSPTLLDTFLEVAACSPGTPIIVLADEADENFANRLLREGAQDVLVKSELECVPLARSVTYAVERQRRLEALGVAPFLDELTGTLSRAGFLTVARPYLQLALEGHVGLLAAGIEIGGAPDESLDDRESCDLHLIRAAEALRAVFDAPALIGRLGQRRFGLIVAGLEESTLERLLNRAASEIEETSYHDIRPARVRFSVLELNTADDLEDLLDAGGGQLSFEAPRHVKPAMLAD